MKERLTFLFLLLAMMAPDRALAQGVRFKGVVTDEDGNPVVGALVKAEAIALNTSISGSGTSKKDGRYGLFVMHPARRYRITVTKDGYKVFAELFDAGSTWTKEHLRIERDFTLEKGSGGGGVQIPEDVRGIYNKGITAYNERDWDTARAKFERVLKIRPRLAAAHHVLAQTCVFQGDNDQALASAKKAVELEPENRQALELLMKIHRGLGNDTEAAEMERALEALSAESED
ncbi:MAG: tetratricopeptide repeat protein [bacterium]|nr:tetratricopeptide repeat protein [bacterium]